MSQLEDDLRKALAEGAPAVPVDVAARLRRVDYRPRTPRLGVALAAGGAVGVAATAGVIISIIGLGTGTQSAFAGWSASPTMPASGQTAAAEAACLAQVPSAADAEHARADGTARAPVMEALLKIAPGEWRTVLADTRGSSTMILLEAGKGEAQASCLSGASASEAVMSVGPVGARTASIAAGQAQVVSTGSQAVNGHQFSYTEGRVGAKVTGITITLNDDTHVFATVANGYFVAWWPGAQQPVSQEVATSSETTTTNQPESASPVTTASPAR